MQKLQYEIIPVIQGARHVDTALFQQDGACPHTANVTLDVLHDVFGSRVLSNRFLESFGCGWSWPPCSPDMNPCDHILWGYLKDHVYRTNPHTVQDLQAETEAVAVSTQS
jgi:hypothetical protein